MDMKYAMLFMLLAIPLVSAVPQGVGALKGAGLEAAMTNVECKTDFMVGVIGSMNEKLGVNDDLSAQVDILQGDVETLNGHADSNDTVSFRDYVHGTYAQHMRDAKDAIRGARKELAANATVCGHGKGKKAGNETGNVSDGNCTSMGQIRKELSDIYKEMKQAYDSCHFGSLKHAADSKVGRFRDAIERKRQKIQNLSAKGISTAELEDLVDEAENEIVDPLEGAVDDAEDAQGLKGAMGKYCLYNGCKNGTSFHFAAKFEIKKLGLILGKIKADAEAKGYGSDVESTEAALESAQSKLDAADDSKMDDAAHDAMWADINSAADAIKALAAKMRSG